MINRSTMHSRNAILYSWYGDDFTGSSDVLEALGIYGVKAVLFTRPPRPRDLKSFPDCRAIGIAGESRSRNPQWMSRNLPSVFRALRSLRAPVNHYKVCSTFDSSPRSGSIGRAMELGRTVFGSQPIPIVVGAPYLGRAVVYGHLFAEADGIMARIDRHPTMRRHPVTPMTEADLRLHLAKQTSLPLGLVDTTAFQSHAAEPRLQTEVAAGAAGIVFDGFSDSMLHETARILWNRAVKRPLFAVGSSGLTHGLLQHWQSVGLIAPARAPAPASPVDRMIVLSGSCSAATARQIRSAKKSGFTTLHLTGVAPWTAQIAGARHALQNGRSVVLYTALGPLPKNTERAFSFGESLGSTLGDLVLATGVRRILIAGGDTATHAVKQLNLDALTFLASLSPGVPLCRAHAPGSPLHGLELALKGGQMGPDDFFAQVRDGQAR